MSRWHVQEVGGCVRRWLASTEDLERRQAVLAWMGAVANGPTAVVTYAWERVGTGHTLYASNVPRANVVMVFAYAVAPMRVVMVVDVIDIDGIEPVPFEE